ncbi:MAG: N-acetylornithine carbamoyltransferase [Armatimonadetes bacterium]|nr:N-acetylornithine carbamoyltransferase [Armatimonadota bacterium]
MNSVTHIRDLGVEGVHRVIEQALTWKRTDPGQHLAGKLLGMVFFNPSLRTRTSFEAAMIRGGGHAVVLEVGGGVWKLEHNDVRMDQDKTEHLREAVPVLGRYLDALAVRSFSQGGGDAEDEADAVVNGFAQYSSVPVISMESAREHPCQGLADLLTLRERFGNLKGLPLTLSWAPHIKPLPKAVPNSFLLTAAAMGCEVRVAHPQGYDLYGPVLAEAKELAQEAGGSVDVTGSQKVALAGSVALYAKAWGPSDPSAFVSDSNRDWMPTLEHFDSMSPEAVLMHCLPVRRDLEVAAEVLDSARSAVIDEAENRFHVQRVLLHRALQGEI